MELMKVIILRAEFKYILVPDYLGLCSFEFDSLSYSVLEVNHEF